jgi:A/G-specific adenine glycosylase
MIPQNSLAEYIVNSDSDLENIWDKAPLNSIRESILGWWKSNKRQYPWRNTKDPYKILIAEVLLHRTQANQVVPIYKSLLKCFPSIKVLAQSDESEILRILYPIGLHWRSKLLHTMAKEIVEKYNGKVPEDFDALISLPGVSHYIASALRCFAFGYPDVLLDTNTVRVTGRILGLKISDSSRRSKQFRFALEKLIDTKHPGDYNWALIDFAALICKSRIPVHEKCPIKHQCTYYLSRAVENKV